MLLVFDNEHPDWFLTDRIAGNRKMGKPAQGSLINQTRYVNVNFISSLFSAYGVSFQA